MARYGQARLRLALPWLADALRAAAAVAPGASVPSADWLASRGHELRRDQTDWRGWLLGGIQGLAELLERHAAGPCIRALEAGTDAHGHWACATPVHLIAGLDHLQLSPEPIVLDGDESAALARSVNEHFADRGFRVHPRSTGPWLLECPGEVQSSAAAPVEVAGRNLRELMPGGPDGTRIRALVNEIQMLLHDHPVNVARTARGIAPVNSLWFWGFGPSRPVGRRPEGFTGSIPALFTDDPWLAGLWLVHGARAEGVDGFSVSRKKGSEDVLVGWTRAPAADPERSCAIAEERVFAPALAALRRNTVRDVECRAGDWSFAADRRSRWRAWRPQLRLAGIVA